MSSAATLVIGGAGGIGQAIAADLAAAGRSLIVADADLAKARTVAGAIVAKNGMAEARAVDLAEPEAIEGLFRSIADDGLVVDTLVNAAGIALAKPIADTSATDWSRIIAVNLGGTFFACRQAALAMPEAGGAIVKQRGRFHAIKLACPRSHYVGQLLRMGDGRS